MVDLELQDLGAQMQSHRELADKEAAEHGLMPIGSGKRRRYITEEEINQRYLSKHKAKP
jgi:hypothetical protein